MSDLPPEVLEAALFRDKRFRLIDLGFEVEQGLRDNRPMQILMERLREDAEAAMEEFAVVNPGDTIVIMGLQARVYRFRYAFETFNAILSRGHEAQAAVMSEDTAERERHD